MRRRIEILVAGLRPPVFLILALFAATGNAEAGGHRAEALVPVLIVVAGLLLFAVTTNDLADTEIDRVNLLGDHRRPLVAGLATRREFIVLAGAGAIGALVVSAALGVAALAVTGGCLVLCAAYSLRPVRIADRGFVAPLLLPACYVAAPYLIGVLSVRPSLTGRDAGLLAGLYLGFVGRIILKDFRDVRGDRLFGKRTFLIRHGRRATCVASAVCWTAGTIILAVEAGRPLRVADLAFLAGALTALRLLATSTSLRRDERLISALAILGRGTVTALLVELAMRHAPLMGPVILTFTAVALTQAWRMVQHGPASALRVPASWSDEARAPAPVRSAPVPTYEFRCRECDVIFEEMRPMADASRPAVCPDGHPDTVKLLSVFASSRATVGASLPAAPSMGGGCCGGGCGCH